MEIVGTPLTSINKVIATGKGPQVFNGYCGAESGFVPVSTVAPTVLISEVELQRTRKDSGLPPVLLSPLGHGRGLGGAVGTATARPRRSRPPSR